MKTKTKPVKVPQIDIRRIVRNPEQPRIVFEGAEMKELAASIREHGVIQPVILEACGDDYILHDGERRWRAAKMAGLKRIPAVVTAPLNGSGPRERLERALVANVQRSEMHPIEEGLGYQRLITEFDYKIGDVAKRTGKAYTRIHYCLNLLNLDAEIQQLMMERKLPCEQKAVEALLTVDRRQRVKLAQALAERNATSKMIVAACLRFNSGKQGSKTRLKGSPAVRLTEMNRPEWDAMYQLGRVPPWPVVTDAIMKTCDACPLRSIASDATCKDCALVVGLKHMMEAHHGKR